MCVVFGFFFPSCSNSSCLKLYRKLAAVWFFLVWLVVRSFHFSMYGQVNYAWPLFFLRIALIFSILPNAEIRNGSTFKIYSGHACDSRWLNHSKAKWKRFIVQLFNITNSEWAYEIKYINWIHFKWPVKFGMVFFSSSFPSILVL